MRLVPRLDDKHVRLRSLDGRHLTDGSGNAIIIDGDVRKDIGIRATRANLGKIMLEALDGLVHVLGNARHC